MSCGDPHEHDCSQVLANLYLFLDSEIDEASSADIRHHLEECGPCLEKYDLDRVVKMLVARSCCEQAPQPLRSKVLTTIRQVQLTISAEPPFDPRR